MKSNIKTNINSSVEQYIVTILGTRSPAFCIDILNVLWLVLILFIDDDQMMDGINLDEIKEFAKAFKLRRLSLGLTQTQVGQALSVTEGPAYSQSAICR